MADGRLRWGVVLGLVAGAAVAARRVRRPLAPGPPPAWPPLGDEPDAQGTAPDSGPAVAMEQEER
jgi:hypothetical protein